MLSLAGDIAMYGAFSTVQEMRDFATTEKGETMYKELIERLRVNAEWAEGNEWEIPLMMHDDLLSAADLLRQKLPPTVLLLLLSSKS